MTLFCGRVRGGWGVLVVLYTLIFSSAGFAQETAGFAQETAGFGRETGGFGRETGGLAGLDGSLQALAQRVHPSVVEVLVTGYSTARGPVTSADALLSLEHGSGSGVLVSSDGYIVTNAHVVDGARRIRVLLPIREKGSGGHSILKTRGKTLGAQLVNLDRETDLAVLKIQGTDYPFLPFGDSDQLSQGQLVMAFGSPLGLDNSVSVGVVSSVVRQLEPEDPMVYIQTDAAINPGNSGGPWWTSAGSWLGSTR